MCGRFTLRTPAKVLTEFFGVSFPAEVAPRYNIAPTQSIWAVRLDDQAKQAWSSFRWGLIPTWAKDPAIGNQMINARSETAAAKPSFRGAFKRRRCLIPADGFYEWKKVGSRKQPLHIRRRDQGPFALAGLWEHWSQADQVIESCTILTTSANDRLRSIHDRMPVILSPNDFDRWLEPSPAGVDQALALMRADPLDGWEIVPVASIVNNARNEVKECLDPAENPGEA